VHASGLPTALGQPDRVSTLAAAQVERATGRQVGGQGGQLGVHPAGPDRFGAGVALLPVLRRVAAGVRRFVVVVVLGAFGGGHGSRVVSVTPGRKGWCRTANAPLLLSAEELTADQGALRATQHQQTWWALTRQVP